MFQDLQEERLILADDAENPQLSALLSMRTSESSSVRLSGASGARRRDTTSRVREPVSTAPPDGLRIPVSEASFEQARMDLTTDL
jgi:hypothetical protein